MNTFNEMSLLPALKKSLEKAGFVTPTEIQAKVIPLLLENLNRDIHAQAQTGTGKTLAFGIPLLQSINPENNLTQALVVAPTRELAVQIYDSLKVIAQGTGITIEVIYGGASMVNQITALKRGVHIVVGTPGRLNDHIRRKTASFKNLKTLVLDEADLMLDMGFREEVEDILNSMPRERNIWLFSATVGNGTQGLIKSHMSNVLMAYVAKQNAVNTQVKQYFCAVPVAKRVDAATRFIEADPDFYGIIFCQTKRLTEEVPSNWNAKG